MASDHDLLAYLAYQMRDDHFVHGQDVMVAPEYGDFSYSVIVHDAKLHHLRCSDQGLLACLIYHSLLVENFGHLVFRPESLFGDQKLGQVFGEVVVQVDLGVDEGYGFV